MIRNVVAVIAGLVAWVVLVTVAGVVLKVSWPAYAAVADAMTFTLPMLIARLSIGIVATMAAGGVAAVLASNTTIVKAMPGVLLLVGFIPVHIGLWNRFPVWYHLFFLLSLVPLTYLGGTLWSRLRITGSAL